MDARADVGECEELCEVPPRRGTVFTNDGDNDGLDGLSTSRRGVVIGLLSRALAL